jgi:hypothetical protein
MLVIVDFYSCPMQFEQVPGRICRPYDGIPGEQDCKVEIWSLRNFGATALDKYSQHDHEKHAGNNLNEGDTAHGNLLSLKIEYGQSTTGLTAHSGLRSLMTAQS